MKTLGVHNNNFNQMTLHTSPGCTLDTTKAATTATNTTAGGESCDVFTGSIISSNCDTSVNGNQGCAIKDPDTKSYGAGLNSAGGAVYAMLWNEEGIRICQFSISRYLLFVNLIYFYRVLYPICRSSRHYRQGPGPSILGKSKGRLVTYKNYHQG